MPEIINAVFENGVFKPLQKIRVKEHQKVTLKIIPNADWEKRFNRIIKKIHLKTAPYSSDEIESDISQAIQEVRKEKYGC
jgi:predicted DNA-binding antitoxin AbrB/MazE fold protein